jgi:thiol-disulfide isomerase/thioredoxin
MGLAISLAGARAAGAQQTTTKAAAAKEPELPGPSNPKAEKLFKEAIEYQNRRMPLAAVGDLVKAVKADPTCVRCAKLGIELAFENGDFKSAIEMAQMLGAAATDPLIKRFALFEEGIGLSREGISRNKPELLEQADARFVEALKGNPKDGSVLFADGLVLAHLNKDAEAKARFEEFLAAAPADDAQRSRAERYVERPELARARMAPNFRVTTLDGQTVSMDGLRGKVVLIDFWATWCGPCNEELPHVKKIAAQYAGQPLVVLSVSWDKDEEKWKEFVAKHGMTWAQYRDADHNFTKLFNIDSIPHYFTVDTDGVLQTEQLGGGDEIDGKLKKMVAAAEKKIAAGQGE